MYVDVYMCVCMYDYHIAVSVKTLARMCVCVHARVCASVRAMRNHKSRIQSAL